MMKKCKITVLKTTLQEDLAKEYGIPNLTTCPLMKEGQVFYTDYSKPEGFCDEAGRRFTSMCSPWQTVLRAGIMTTGSILSIRVLRFVPVMTA